MRKGENVLELCDKKSGNTLAIQVLKKSSGLHNFSKIRSDIMININRFRGTIYER